jgi:folate-dependent phosphoribosylglycinamide formyltransferase PurN
MAKLKIAIISNDDNLWSLYAWNNVFNSQLFGKEYEVAGFWTCEQKFCNNNRVKIWKWYLNIFGAWNFFKLFCFVISYQVVAFIKSLSGQFNTSFKGLCRKNNVPYFQTPSPNDPDFIKWVKENNIDVLIIMVDHILKAEIINSPNICVINKHASMLPVNKGLFPFFWAKVNNEIQGISFHKVNEAIDEGDLYFQQQVTAPSLLSSMIIFYFYVHHNYFSMLGTALNNIAASQTVTPPANLSSSYYGRPTTAHYAAFKKNGGRLINFKDIFLPLHLLKS